MARKTDGTTYLQLSNYHHTIIIHIHHTQKTNTFSFIVHIFRQFIRCYSIYSLLLLQFFRFSYTSVIFHYDLLIISSNSSYFIDSMIFSDEFFCLFLYTSSNFWWISYFWWFYQFSWWILLYFWWNSSNLWWFRQSFDEIHHIFHDYADFDESHLTYTGFIKTSCFFFAFSKYFWFYCDFMEKKCSYSNQIPLLRIPSSFQFVLICVIFFGYVSYNFFLLLWIIAQHLHKTHLRAHCTYKHTHNQ